MIDQIRSSPLLSRVIPFAVFALLTLGQGRLGDAPQYWIYALKTIAGAGLLWLVRPAVAEMRWKFSWEALAAGLLVFAVWIGLDGRYPLLDGHDGTFNPLRTYGPDSVMAWMFITIRLLGSSLVVPPLEEVFYRSFLYRFIRRHSFLEVPLERFHWRAFLATGVIFGLSHFEWLPGILCAFVYQWLVCRKKRLGDAITAHAITNFLLGIWVITFNEYHFW